MLTVYVLLAGPLLVFLFVNRNSAEIFSHSSVLLASLLPVFLSVLALVKDETISHQLEMRVIFDRERKIFLQGGGTNAYTQDYAMVFSGLGNLPLGTLFDHDEGKSALNLIEKGVLDALAYEFQAPWTENAAPFDSGYLSRTFTHNKILTTPATNATLNGQGSMIFPMPPGGLFGGILTTIFLPSGCELLPLPIESTTRRSFVIRKRQSEIRFDIRSNWGSIMQHRESWLNAFDLPATFDETRFFQMAFRVDVSLKVHWFARLSSGAEEFRQTYSRAVSQLSRFDWPAVQEKIDRELESEAIQKILKTETK